MVNMRKPTIDSKLLVNLSKSGRNVLAYIIDKHMGDNNVIRIDRLDMSNYIAEHVGKKESNTWNVDRGVKDLVSNDVLVPSKSVDGVYIINTKLLSK